MGSDLLVCSVTTKASHKWAAEKNAKPDVAEDTWVKYESPFACGQLLPVTGKFQLYFADAQTEVTGKTTRRKRCFTVSTGDDLLAGWSECQSRPNAGPKSPRTGSAGPYVLRSQPAQWCGFAHRSARSV